jgi:hypothetical protein
MFHSAKRSVNCYSLANELTSEDHSKVVFVENSYVAYDKAGIACGFYSQYSCGSACGRGGLNEYIDSRDTIVLGRGNDLSCRADVIGHPDTHYRDGELRGMLLVRSAVSIDDD